ncbi:MAG: hypothetical protein IJ187_06975 [Neisseriaceae bacterium]|nr:hypothetical protein [Neisseriaceae bacterium]MBQ9725210.1 hypothetical protein [Neisseriaceae bacterium]
MTITQCFRQPENLTKNCVGNKLPTLHELTTHAGRPAGFTMILGRPK